MPHLHYRPTKLSFNLIVRQNDQSRCVLCLFISILYWLITNKIMETRAIVNAFIISCVICYKIPIITRPEHNSRHIPIVAESIYDENVWISISIQFQITLLSPNIHFPQYTYTKRLHQRIHKQFSESIQCYGSKWSWKSCWIYGLLVWYTKYHLSQQGCKGAGGATVTTHFVSNMQHTAL